jgi:hypothetical protein
MDRAGFMSPASSSKSLAPRETSSRSLLQIGSPVRHCLTGLPLEVTAVVDGNVNGRGRCKAVAVGVGCLGDHWVERGANVGVDVGGDVWRLGGRVW